MKKRIVMLPLDERPCNFDFPAMMPKTDCELVLPPKGIMGDKKNPGDIKAISEWVKENSKTADAVVLSLDTLVYGGILPSRLHMHTKEELIKRVDILKSIKAANPLLKLYAFGLIMRCPCYSSNDEEPDYYGECGEEIHLYGRYMHLEKLGKLTEEDKEDFNRVKGAVRQEYIDDYLNRRKLNLEVLMHALSYVKNGVVDYFIVPQDDAAVYGFTAMDQMLVRRYLKENILHKKTAMYPSADDTGLTLLARANAQLSGVRPRVFVHYASSKGGQTIPIVEDRPVAETVKYHILSVDGIQVYSLFEADILLAVNVGSEMHELGELESVIPYDIERNLAEFVNCIQYALSLEKTVAIADIARLNKGDTELVSILHNEHLLTGIHAYAGWNTSSNTIGTTLCQAIMYMIGNDKKGNIRFLLHRYYEDVGYMAYARQHITENVLPKWGYNYFCIDAKEGRVSEAVANAIDEYMNKNYPQVAALVKRVNIRMPWTRMFEADVKLELEEPFL